MSFTEEIDPLAAEYWAGICEHPMVEALGDGTLEASRFRYWVAQDYVYLIEYNRVFALGAAKANTLDRMSTFAELLDETVTTEMDLHREYASEFGITESALESTEPSPTTRGYTDFLVRTAAQGSFGDTVAAILPCMWGFNETGERLAAAGPPDHEQYAAWIEMYSSEAFGELTAWCKDLMDEVAAESTEADRDRYRAIFETSAQYEYLFWDAAWRQEEWPL